MTQYIKKISTKLRAILVQLTYLPQVLTLVWQAVGYWMIIWAILLIIQGVLPALEIYLVKMAINSLVALAGNHVYATNLPSAFVNIALLVGLMLLEGALASLYNWVRALQTELTQDYLTSLIHNKAISLDLGFFESPEYYNRLHRAHVEAKNHAVALLENLGELARSFLTLLSVIVVLLPLGIWLPLGLLASSLPPIYVVYKTNRKENHWRRQNTSAQRYADYYDSLITSQESAAELRLFSLGTHFQTSYQSLRQRLRREKMQLMQQRSIAQFGASFFSMFIIGVALSWMVGQMAKGKLSLGDLALLLQSLWLAQGTLYYLLGNLSKSYQNLLHLQDLFEFLTLKPKIHTLKSPQPPLIRGALEVVTPLNKRALEVVTPLNKRALEVVPPLIKGGLGGDQNPTIKKSITFEQVSFHYPNSQHLALDNFTLSISTEEIIAIVGENGSGKSTFVKLMCRFYDPCAGRITIDGKDIRDLSLAELYDLITVQFQFPVHYHDTAANNIAISSVSAPPTRQEIEAVAKATGADIAIEQLPEGYDTLLGKWFGTAELSGGQWQRIALARAWLRKAPIVILDEPTSAMDAWAEINWLGNLRQLAQGRTVIIITHRFTTAKLADTIHVMSKGQIIESGTHEELLVKGGSYAQSWQAQAKLA